MSHEIHTYNDVQIRVISDATTWLYEHDKPIRRDTNFRYQIENDDGRVLAIAPLGNDVFDSADSALTAARDCADSYLRGDAPNSETWRGWRRPRN